VFDGIHSRFHAGSDARRAVHVGPAQAAEAVGLLHRGADLFVGELGLADVLPGRGHPSRHPHDFDPVHPFPHLPADLLADFIGAIHLDALAPHMPAGHGDSHAAAQEPGTGHHPLQDRVAELYIHEVPGAHVPQRGDPARSALWAASSVR